MKTAIIDMGTNTFHLLVAEIDDRHFNILWRERIAVRIGAGGINQGLITASGVNRALEALTLFKGRVASMGVATISAFGTSALRNATNGGEIIAKIKSATGIDAQIISGDEEAGYIYRGVCLAFQLGKEKSLIMDIGGGSVEFIIGNGENIFWKQSFEIGAQRLLERFQKHDPIRPEEIADLRALFNQMLSPLFAAMRIHEPKILAGSSGTFDTLSDIYCLQSGMAIKDLPETPFSLNAFAEIHGKIISGNRAQRMQIPGMIEMRVDMIVVACCLIDFILDTFHFERIRVSSYSLKEGVLATLVDAAKQVRT